MSLQAEVDLQDGDDIVVFYTRIVGRPDTPCRFQAAIQARDEDFKILESGDRERLHI